MAVTYAFTPDAEGREVVGRDRAITGTLTITGTYTAGGDALGADDAAAGRLFGLARLDSLEFLDPVSSAGMIPRYDKAARKIVGHGGAAAGAVVGQVTAGATVTGTIRVTAWGK